VDGRRPARGERGRLAAALERHVRAVVAGPVPPPSLEDGRHVVGERQRGQPERLGDRQPVGGRVDHDDLGRAVVAGQQPGQQPDHAGADDQHPPAGDPVGQRPHRPADRVRGRVQHAVRADRPHVRDVHAEDRVEVVRQRTTCSAAGSATYPVACPYGAATRVPTGSAAVRLSTTVPVSM
jgi:hypothetical protein